MKKARFTEEQMVAILREADKTPVAEVARKHKLSEQTIYNWRRHFGTLEQTDIKRLRGLETENAKLKLILAEPVGGESMFKRRSGSETARGNVAAKRSDQAQQERGRARPRVAPAWSRGARDERDQRCNSL